MINGTRRMKFYISATGIKRVITISSGGGGAGKGSAKDITAASATSAAGRRISARAFLPAFLVLCIVLPFLFVRIAFLVLESARVCSSSDCVRWRFFSEGDTSLKLRDELTRVLLEAAKNSNVNEEEGAESFNEFVTEITTASRPQDLEAFAFKTKAMLSRMEHKVQSAKHLESAYWHLASHGVPKSLHCLSLKLAEEYSVNSMARSPLPPPEYVSRLSDPTFHHLLLLTDNILAASVVVNSTVENSANPENLVFHIVTDKKTFTSMHAWFATNLIKSAVVEVKGLHQYDWSKEVNVGVQDILEINDLIWKHHLNDIEEKEYRYMEGFRPSSLSLMNHLCIYIPELLHHLSVFVSFGGSPYEQLFPDLNKIVYLEDDVVVQHDISSLWELDLNGKVCGSVFKSSEEDSTGFPGSKYINYLNFSHPLISSKFDPDQNVWLYGLNIFDLEAWRRSNITQTFLEWLKLNFKCGLTLWKPGVFPPCLIAFEGKVHPIDSSWLVSDLGYHHTSLEEEISLERLESAAVIHFSGPAKPWLEIGFPEVRSLWNRYVNFSDKFIRRCGFTQ
ncbi:putative galacturonosyltransferase 15 isoform X1 [Senna tora]|uniref:Hexosyltransferase n=1 Tax=Senna tora TaxID=362788 RepID=A0A834T3R2_9FABA|nr:putative galacturonosyltransferase 15 isoform X1 [Senna tora]